MLNNRTRDMNAAQPSPRILMKIPRREFLKQAAAVAAISNLPLSPVTTGTALSEYSYLGRTQDYAEYLKSVV